MEKNSIPNDSTDSFPEYYSTCWAATLGFIEEFSECLSNIPTSCPFRLSFGESFFCQHPCHKEIVERSRGKSG